MAAAFYAVVIVWWGGRGGSKGKGERGGGSRTKGDFNKGRVLWMVPVVYALIAGVEGVLAGSVVGLM